MKLWLNSACILLLLGLPAISTADPPSAQLLSLGRMNEAISVLANRNDAESFNQLSRAYYAMERWNDAVKYGERAVALRPQEASYHLWLAREYGRKAAESNPLLAASLARKAKNEFELAVRLDPASAQARVDLARYYTEAPAIMGGGLDKAREQAQELRATNPALAELILARVAAKEKRYTEAEGQYRQAIQQAVHPADCWIQIAEFYRVHARFPEMQAALHTATAQADKPAEVYFDAATQLLLGDRDFPDAVEFLQKYLASGELVETAPAFRAHYLLGQTYEKMGRKPQAASEYLAALSLASGFEPASNALRRLR